MTSEDAFETIINAIRNDTNKSLVTSKFYEEIFGTFIIAFMDGDRERSVVSDRYELVICNDLSGDDCKTVIPSTRDVDQDTLLSTLGLR